jgi:hypothetical protein
VSSLVTCTIRDQAIGSGKTDAWADICMSGAGGVSYDPTNPASSAGNLIRVAVTRDIGQAVAVSGNFVATPDDYLGMLVSVFVERE